MSQLLYVLAKNDYFLIRKKWWTIHKKSRLLIQFVDVF